VARSATGVWKGGNGAPVTTNNNGSVVVLRSFVTGRNGTGTVVSRESGPSCTDRRLPGQQRPAADLKFECQKVAARVAQAADPHLPASAFQQFDLEFHRRAEIIAEEA